MPRGEGLRMPVNARRWAVVALGIAIEIAMWALVWTLAREWL